MCKFRYYLFISLLISGIFFISNCSSSFNSNVERGSNYYFLDGYPEFTLTAIGYQDDDLNPYVNVIVEIIGNSLIIDQKDTPVAKYSLEYKVNYPGENKILARETYQIPVQELEVSGNRILLDKDFRTKSGEFEIHVVLTDLVSGKTLQRSSRVFIPNATEEEFTLSNLLLFAKGENTNFKWQPITVYDVSEEFDSLRFDVQLLTKRSDTKLSLNSKLVRFKSDHSPALPLYRPNRGQSSITYKGIDYDKKNEIQSSRRILDEYGNVHVQFYLENFKRGNYRFEIIATRADGISVKKIRDFGIKSKNYPFVKSSRELAAPLVYLMDRNEHREMMKITNSDSLKEAVDRFWLKNIESEKKAREVIELYYNRVEEANRLFSNFKEGWKTDPGLIYILYGPPWYNEITNVDVMRWGYEYIRRDPELNFIFTEPFITNNSFPFKHYILRRNRSLYESQYKQKQLWLSGRILTRNV